MSKVAWDELSRSISRLLLDEPFLGHLLAGIPRRIDPTIQTAAVALRPGGSVLLIVNPDFFVKRITRGPERIAVVKHEILHLLLRHLYRREKRDPLMWNLACDVVVNSWVRPWPLPAGAVTRATFPEIDLTGDLSAVQVYDRLLAEAEREGLADLEAGAPGDHDQWGEPSEADVGVGEASLDRLVRQAHARARGWGNLPAGLASQLATWLVERTPSLDWRRVLRGFTNGSRRTALKSTLRRPSRRFGTLPGNRIQRWSHLLVAVDTSGSVSDEQLAMFFHEIHAAWRAGAEVTVVECDAAVHRVWEYAGKAPTTITGRGGTAFEPVFAWAREQWPKRFDGIVYLTDGEGPAPTTRPSCPVLWLVTGGAEPEFFGRVVRLRD